MTNEEVIAILEAEAEYLYSQDEPYNWLAFKKAIEALKAYSKTVRCKDCKHWAMHSWCARLAPFDKVYMRADDYCSKGKRWDEVEE